MSGKQRDRQLMTFLRWLRNHAADLPEGSEREVYTTCADMLQGLLTDATVRANPPSQGKEGR